MVTPKDKEMNHINISKIMSTITERDEIIRIIESSTNDDNPFLAARFATFKSVAKSDDLIEIVNRALHTKNVGQVEPTIIFLSRHGEHTDNPEYVTNIDTVELLLTSESWDQAYYRGQVANHLTNWGFSQDKIHEFMCLIGRTEPYESYKSVMQACLNLLSGSGARVKKGH